MRRHVRLLLLRRPRIDLARDEFQRLSHQAGIVDTRAELKCGYPSAPPFHPDLELEICGVLASCAITPAVLPAFSVSHRPIESAVETRPSSNA